MRRCRFETSVNAPSVEVAFAFFVGWKEQYKLITPMTKYEADIAWLTPFGRQAHAEAVAPILRITEQLHERGAGSRAQQA